MKKFLIILMLPLTCTVASAGENLPNFGLRLNTIDVYEVAIGYLWDGDHFGYGMNIEGNHNKVGYENVIYYKTDEYLHSTKAIYIRPKIEYYSNEDNSFNIHKIKHEAYGMEAGIGMSGHSPLINTYVGLKYEPRNDNYFGYAGIALNL